MKPNPSVISEIDVVGLARYSTDGRFLAGFYRYCQPTKRWLVRNAGHDRAGLDILLARPGQVIVAQVTDATLARQLRALARPVIDLAGEFSDQGFIQMRPDDRAVGALAARHFLERGFRNFAFVSAGRLAFERERYAGFAAALATAGHQAPWFRKPAAADPAQPATQLWDWLRELPKPLAVLTPSDSQGKSLCDWCRLLDLSVPDAVAVLGVDDDSLVCAGSWPPLSSVQLPAEQMGYQAAALVDQLLSGQPVAAGPHLFAPTGIELRASTDLLAHTDPRVVAALRHIRDHATGPLRVAAIVAQVGGDRRTLEKRFRAATGHSLLTEIHRVRIAAACQQLIATDQKLPLIAERCGYPDVKAFAEWFRHIVQESPGAYRRRHRLADPAFLLERSDLSGRSRG